MNDFNRGALQVPCLRLNFGFGEQWESIELGDGTGYVRLGDYEKLESENAKLRTERDHLIADSNPTAAELRSVRSAWKKDREENAKLRELVQGLWSAAQYLGMNPDGATGRVFARQMRELGIEVDS